MKATTVVLHRAFLSAIPHCSEVLPQSLRDTVNFTCAVSLLGCLPCPRLQLIPTLMAASTICQALVFLLLSCLPVCHAVCLVSLASYSTNSTITAHNPLSSSLSGVFASLIHVV